MRIFFLDATCIAVLCVILTLGLWPFHSPKNDVSWLRNSNGLRFGRDATAMSSSAFRITNGESGESASVELWLQPRHIWVSQTILAFYTAGNPNRSSLRQSLSDLELNVRTGDDLHPANAAHLYVTNVLRRPGPVFVTISSGMHGTAVYINGILDRTAARFRFFPRDFVGRLLLGDSPRQPDSWSGQFLGLAIYCRELTAARALRHYQTWTQREQPEISQDDGNIALYLFNERGGSVAHNRAGSGVDLNIPERYVVLDKVFLEPFWKEFSMSRSYWGAVMKNIVGFIPFGFCFWACLSAHGVRRSALATVILGGLVSVTIEVLQAYLPTRDSGMTDIFTNTLGTYVGVAASKAASPMLVARFMRLPLTASSRG